MKKVFTGILLILILAVLIFLVTRCATISNSFEIKVESDIDLRIIDGDSYRKFITKTYKKGLLRTSSATRSNDPKFYAFNDNGNVKAVDKEKYVISFEITFQGTDGYNNVYPEIVFETSNEDTKLQNSLRVLIVNGDNSYLFAPGANANKEYKAVKSSDNGKPVYNETNELISSISKTSIIDRVDMYQEITLKFYVWFEALDSGLNNFKAKGNNTNKLEIIFNR